MFASIGNPIVLSLLFFIFSPYLLSAVYGKSYHSIVLPIRSRDLSLYIRPAISLELGLKPNLVFNPRLVASPVSLLRVHSLESLQTPLKLVPLHCITVHLAVAVLHFKRSIQGYHKGASPFTDTRNPQYLHASPANQLLRARHTLRPLDLNTS